MSNTTAKIDAEEREEPKTSLKSLFHDTKVDGGKKSVWQMTLETFGMAEGTSHQNDVTTDSFETALRLLQGMIQDVQDIHPKWKFTFTPLRQFDATVDDLLTAFVLWSRKEQGEPMTYNVSNAFRRLESYATWMEDHRDFLESPLTADSVKQAAIAWQQKMTYAPSGQLVWWFDFEALDLKLIRSSMLPYSDSLRYMVWLSHLVMFDKNAQEQGMLIVQNMASKSMIATMTMVPMELGTKIDRFTIGVLPIKMKSCYIYNHRGWFRILSGLMKPFMSKKMTSRMILLSKEDVKVKLQEKIGQENIPMSFQELGGSLEKDIIFGKYITLD
jgi:CRAL/TRIO domain